MPEKKIQSSDNLKAACPPYPPRLDRRALNQAASGNHAAETAGYSRRADKINKSNEEQANGITRVASAIKEMLNKEGEVVKATKTDSGWEIEFEVVEQSEYMKKIGIPKPVYDKNLYYVLLDNNFNLLSYERKGQKSGN